MSQITVGRAEGKPVKLDLNKLVDTRMLIQANSGGGKSWLLRLMIERAAKHVQVIILDPEGEFSTLREKLDMALVGKDGEMATDLRSAALLARKLVELNIPAVVDLYDLKLNERRAYVRLFLEALMAVPRAFWHPVLIVIDEAHLFAPERSAGDAESTGAVIGLMSQGRKRGFAGVISTQRLSKLHKDVAAEANNVVIGRTWLDTDQQRAGDLLGMGKADRAALRDLEPGEFYAFGPSLLTNGVVRFQSEAVTTTHPKAGERHKMAVPQASAAIREVVEQIGDLPAQAEQEKKDLAGALREVAELKRQLRARPVEQKVETVEKRVEVPVLKDNEAAQLEQAVAQLRAMADEITAELRAVRSRPVLPVARPAPIMRPRPLPRQSAPAAPVGDVALKAGERKMLQALAQRHPLRYTRAQVGTLAGFAPRGGTFGNYFGTLKRVGFIEQQGEEVSITEAGLDYLGTDIPAQPTTTEEMLRLWRERLKAGEVVMLDALVAVYPGGMSRSALGEVSGFTHTGGTFGNYLGTLRRNGLVDVRGDMVTASDTLFID